MRDDARDVVKGVVTQRQKKETSLTWDDKRFLKEEKSMGKRSRRGKKPTLTNNSDITRGSV
jgi:hypothetical protein